MYAVGEKAAGVFTDNNGHVIGIADSFFGACEFTDVIGDMVADGQLAKKIKICPIKLAYKPVDEMITYGVDKTYKDRIEEYYKQAHFVNETPVYIAVMKAPAIFKHLLDSGDMILELNDKPVFRVNEIHSAAATAEVLKFKIFRMSTNIVETVAVPTRNVPTINFNRFVTWCGINIR
jgi:hypothetical protein